MSPRVDPNGGAVIQMTSGLGAYEQDCNEVRFTFTKYTHGTNGLPLGGITISETGTETADGYTGMATVTRFGPDGTPNPVSGTATTSFTRVTP